MDNIEKRELHVVINANLALAELKDKAMFIANSSKVKNSLINLSNFINSRENNSTISE